jgi:uncharacterized membrane protein
MFTSLYREGLILRLILVLSLIGIALSGFLTYAHYNVASLPPGICPGDGCSDVWTSEYATILGIPVAVLGLLGYIALFGLSYLRLYYRDLEIVENFPTYMLIFAIVGGAFSIYLTAIEFFVIHAVCDYCFSAFIVMMVILGLITFGVLKGEKRAASLPDD